MGRIQLGIGTEFVWRKVAYRIVSCDGDTFTAKDPSGGLLCQQFTLAEILDHVSAGALKFRQDEYDCCQAHDGEVKTHGQNFT